MVRLRFNSFYYLSQEIQLIKTQFTTDGKAILWKNLGKGCTEWRNEKLEIGILDVATKTSEWICGHSGTF